MNDRGAKYIDQEFSVISHISSPVALLQPPPHLILGYILSNGLLERAIKQHLVQTPIRADMQMLLWMEEQGVLPMGGAVPQAEEKQIRGREAEGIPALLSKQLSLRRCPCRRFVISNDLFVLTSAYWASEI